MQDEQWHQHQQLFEPTENKKSKLHIKFLPENLVMPPCYQSLFFACSILVYLRKILHQSSTYKIFVEHTLHVITLKDTVFNQSGLAMTIGLQTNGCSHSKNQFERKNKIDLFEVIQTEPHALGLDNACIQCK